MSAQEPAPGERRAGVWLCLAAALVWSSGGLFIKRIELPAMEIAGLRGIFSAALFALLWSRQERPAGRWSFQATVGALSVAFTVLFFVMATRWTTAAAAIFLQSSAPAWVLVLGWVLLGLVPSRTDALALVGCGLGLALFFVGKLSGASFWGNVVALLSGVAFGIHILSMRQVDGTLRLPVLAWGNALAALLALGGAASGLTSLVVREELAFSLPTLPQWLNLLYLGIVQIGLGYSLFVLAIRRITSMEASLLVLLEPVLNPVWVYLGTGESPGGWAVAGGVLVLATLAWHTVRAHGRPAPIASSPASTDGQS